MEVTLLCNAGLAVHDLGETLLIDLPNKDLAPFYALPDSSWSRICAQEPPFENVCGFFFTHDHPDHLDRERLHEYLCHQDVPVFMPADGIAGRIRMGHFEIEYFPFDHAPIPDPPVHVVTLIRSGDKMLYVAADASLDCDRHRTVLGDKKPNLAVWTSMYLSRPETRMLLNTASEQNLIYHMPIKPDEFGMWKKCERNIERFGHELTNVVIPDTYPATIYI